MILRTAVVIAMIFSFSFYIADIKDKKIENKNLLQAEVKTKSKTEEKTLKEVASNFLGTPYKKNPLGEEEGELLYRTDYFDCTTFVLSVIAEKKANHKTPQDIMLEINYHPPSNVSYNNRNHFTTYRNKISPYFEDITKSIGENYTKTKKIVLNKKTEGKRIIDINWEEEVTIYYILSEDVKKITNNIPREVGVGFVNTSRFSEGLDVVHEGLLFDRETLFHASLKEKKVVQQNFLEYLDENNHSGVLFYKIN